jgi:exonuclease SbcC
MNFLRRLFSPKPASKPVRSVTPPVTPLEQQSPEQLLNIARTESSDSQREGAIARLPFSSELVALAKNPNGKIQAAARKRIGQLLEDGSITLAQLQAQANGADDLIHLISYAPAAQQEFLVSVTDPATLLQLASEGASSQLRQAAANRLETRDELEKLCKRVQSKDKNVFKIAKSKLDVFKADDARLAVVQQQAGTLCEKLEKLSRVEADSLYKARVELLENEWSGLAAEASPVLAERYQQALAGCRQQIEKRAEIIALEEEQQALDQQADAFSRSARSEALALVEELENTPELTEDLANQFRQKLNDLQQAARLAASRTGPATDVQQILESSRHYALNLLEQFSRHGTLLQLQQTLAEAGENLSAETRQFANSLIGGAREFHQQTLPAVLQSIQEQLQSLRQRESELNRQIKENLRNIEDLVRRGLRSAEQGMVRKARGIHKEVQEKTAGLSSLPQSISNKLADLDQAIHRLADWHEFAVTPKKEALITQMQALATSTLAPNDLATRIHDLQDEWRSLSKGVQQADETLWEQFQQASQVAFAPCKEFFDEQTREREANLEKRRELTATLQTYIDQYDWDNAVWKDVEQTLKVARQEWQGYWPIPRKAAEALQEAFDQLMDQVYNKLKQYYQANKQLKQELITSAEALTQQDNLPEAIEGIKQLQARWKNIGKSYPREDQQLWHNFRQHCDAVFARRAGEQNEQQAFRQQQAQQATALTEELQALATRDYESLLQSNNRVEEIKQSFKALNELPRDQQKSITQAFYLAADTIRDRIRAERNQAEIQSWQDLFALANDVLHYENGLLAGNPQNALATALADKLASAPTLPAGTLPVLQQRFDRAAQLDRSAREENTTRLQTLTIRAEIAAGLPTPESDKQRRMSYQISQLQQAFGQQDAALESLVFEWIAIGGVNEADYQPLFVRFMECLAAGENTKA